MIRTILTLIFVAAFFIGGNVYAEQYLFSDFAAVAYTQPSYSYTPQPQPQVVNPAVIVPWDTVATAFTGPHTDIIGAAPPQQSPPQDPFGTCLHEADGDEDAISNCMQGE